MALANPPTPPTGTSPAPSPRPNPVRSSSGPSHHSSISSSSTAAPSDVLTLPVLLAAHQQNATAALTAVLAERNTLSAQNAQLWKLIERQRATQAGMQKDLDRIRAERDKYRRRAGRAAVEEGSTDGSGTGTPRRAGSGRDVERTPRMRADEVFRDAAGAGAETESSASRSRTITQESTATSSSAYETAASYSSPIEASRPSLSSSDTRPSVSADITRPSLSADTTRRPSLTAESVLSPSEASPSRPQELSYTPRQLVGLPDVPPVSPFFPADSTTTTAAPSPQDPTTPPQGASPRLPEPSTPRASAPSPQGPSADENSQRQAILSRQRDEVDAERRALEALEARQQQQQQQQQTPTQAQSSSMPHPPSVQPPPRPSAPAPPQPTTFRLLPSHLPVLHLSVRSSAIRTNDRGKDVVSFLISLRHDESGAEWRIDKLYSDVLALDARIKELIRRAPNRSVNKGRVAPLPDKALLKDRAPNKVDQRRATLENYLHSLLTLAPPTPAPPFGTPTPQTEVCAFLSTDLVRASAGASAPVGYKEGYLTKRGKNFGGWKTRFFVISKEGTLDYFETRGGNHIGSIRIADAQIGRQQQRATDPSSSSTSLSSKSDSTQHDSYRHAFLIVERTESGKERDRHVLCAESDEERDAWIAVLLYHVKKGAPTASASAGAPSSSSSSPIADPSPAPISRSGTSGSIASSSEGAGGPQRRGTLSGGRKMSKDDIMVQKGAAQPISNLPPDVAGKFHVPAQGIPAARQHGRKLSATSVAEDFKRSDSPMSMSSATPPPQFHVEAPLSTPGRPPITIQHQPQFGHLVAPPSDMPMSSSLPNNLGALGGSSSNGGGGGVAAAAAAWQPPRSNSELGQYMDLAPPGSQGRTPGNRASMFIPTPGGPSGADVRRQSFNPPVSSSSVSSTAAATPAVGPSPSARGKISGPMNGTPIPEGYRFGAKEEAPVERERDRKAKSGRFWGAFGGGGRDKHGAPAQPRPVFGVPLSESLSVASVGGLPAIVFRAIQYLQAKNAQDEEGLYRLSGSSAVIKALRERFNQEGDVDLLESGEYYDPHAIAGLLKGFLRELPTSVLTRDLHLPFLHVVDLLDPKERVRELGRLVSELPEANYCLLRALTAHLITIVQNAEKNRMTLRNVGIVFSPTLGLPAPLFSLFLTEYQYIFNVTEEGQPAPLEIEDDVAAAAEQQQQASQQPQQQTAANPASWTGGQQEIGAPSGERTLTGGAGLPPPRPPRRARDNRNSAIYEGGDVEKMLGLAGRDLRTTAEAEESTDGEDIGPSEPDDDDLNDDDDDRSSTADPLDQMITIDVPPPAANLSPSSSRWPSERGLNFESGSPSARSFVGLPPSPRPSVSTGSAGGHSPRTAHHPAGSSTG